MLKNNFATYGTKILFDITRDILYFPVWWYSRGLLMVALALNNFLVNRQKSLALFVWIKNIFKPMYGQHDWQGFIISFFMRVIQIIFRSIVLLFWTAISLAIFLLWIISPIFVIYQIFFQILPPTIK